MPTNRQRHTITEVGPVEEALDRVRAARGRVDLRELIVLGAEVAVRRAEEDRATAAQQDRERRELIEFLTRGPGIEPEAAREVREHGLSRDP